MAGKARINLQGLTLEVERQVGKVRAFRVAADAAARRAFDRAKETFMEAFDTHPITQELEEGPDAVGSSVLPEGYGNLFSFIGFYSDESPIEELRAYLDRNIRLRSNPVIQPYRYLYTVSLPTEDDLASVTPMPFGTAKSWVLSLEKGIPGFNRYLFDLEREFAASRSGPAVQTDKKHILRGGSVGPKPYLSTLFNEFRRALIIL